MNNLFAEDDERRPDWWFSPWRGAIEALLYGKVQPMAFLLDYGHPIPMELGLLLAQAFRCDPNLPFRFKLVANPRAGQKKSGRPHKQQPSRDQRLKEFAGLMESGHPIPKELGKKIAASLRAEPNYPYRLHLSPNPKAGKKRNGRWPEMTGYRDFFLAQQMAKKMKEGMSYDTAAQAVSGIGDQTVKKAYSKNRDMFLESDFVARWDDWAIELTKIKKTVAAIPQKSPELSSPIAKWMLGGDSRKAEKRKKRKVRTSL